MSLSTEQIKNAFKKFINFRNANHRYASFDYCYNYFNSFPGKSSLASPENIEKSCLHLGFYLASWGMMRASSFLIQKSLRFYIPIINWLASTCPLNAWNIDINNYNNDTIETLINIYNGLSLFVPYENRKLVLITKIMLGVFGSTPAFDDNFTMTFREHYGENTRYRSFNNSSLTGIKEFYKENVQLLEEMRQNHRTYNFLTGNETDIIYTRAKIIDMIGFGYQLSE